MMKVLGISGSPHKRGITAQLVEKTLEAAGGEGEFISLAGKNIRPCATCLALYV